MLTDYTVDKLTLLKSIELLDRYSWLLMREKGQEHEYDKKYLAVTIKNLRNAIKSRDINV